MKIRFVDREISRAPLAVLKNLYYYTVQYGLSVRQFTGKHPKYWEDLPKKLRKAQKKPKELEKIIVELEKLAAKSEERLAKRRAHLNQKWAEKEVILNEQLISVLCAVPGPLLALTFRKLTDAGDYPSGYRVVSSKIEGEKGEHTDFVEPDLLLLGGEQLLMVELKTKGGEASSRKYPPTQLLNYLRLAALCRDTGGKEIPMRFQHLILVPTADEKWLIKSRQWVKNYDIESGLLTVDPDGCLTFARGYYKKNRQRFHQLITDTPVYLRSWKQLEDAFKSSVDEFGDDHNREHWDKIAGEFYQLAQNSARYV